MSEKIKGSLFAMGATALWSTAFIAPKFLMNDHGADPVSIGAIRYISAGLIMYTIAFFSKGPSIIASTRSFFWKGMVLGLLGMTGMFGLLSLSLKYTSATNSAVLVNSSAFLTVILAVTISEKITVKKAAGVALGLAGAYLVVNKAVVFNLFSSSSLTGDLLAAGSALCWSVYMLLTKKWLKGSPYSGLHVTAITCLFGGIILLLINFLAGTYNFPVNPMSIFWMIFLVVFATCIGYFLWYGALSKIDAGSASVFQFITPVFAAGLAYLFLGETLSSWALIGMVFVAAGIIISAR